MSALGKFLLKSDLNAALFAFGCLMLVFIGIPGQFMAAVVIAMITIKKGYKAGAVVLAFVALPAVVFLMLAEVSPFDAVFLQCIIVWLFAGMLQKYNSWVLIFELMAVISVVCVGMFHLLVADPTHFWLTQMTKLVEQLSADLSSNIDIKQMHQRLVAIAPYMTGLIAFSVTLIMFVELLLARVWAIRLTAKPAEAGKVLQKFSEIHVGWVDALVVSIVLAGVALQMAFARDCVAALLLPFMIGGLSYLHYLARQHRQLVYLLAVIYFGLLMPSIALKLILVVAAIGYVDSWCNFRRRFTAKSAAIY